MPDENLLLDTKSNEDYTLKIYIDPDPLDPRARWDTLGNMYCFHKRANLGDDHNLDRDQFNSYDEIEDYIYEELDAEIVKTLYLYQHSGMTMSLTPFHSRWDSGKVGFIFVTEDRILDWFQEDELTDEVLGKAEEVLRNEVKNYDAYISGEMYGYQIVDKHACPECGTEHEEIVDSCWGFFTKENIIERWNEFND